MSGAERLRAEHLSITFGQRTILNELSLGLAEGLVTAIIGPNACGKSTLLRSFARLQPVEGEQVILDGKAIGRQGVKSVARRLAILPQSPLAPEGLRVHDLIARGRTPHQSALRQWSRADAQAVARALDLTGMRALADRPLDALSGGQRQRAWIAMALAQDTEILLLDEPTTYLDLRHQIELLRLIRTLNRDGARTVAMVLHDVNQAARFADRIVAMKNGRIVVQGTAEEVVTPTVMRDVFDLECSVIRDPLHGTPHVIPA